MQRIAIAMLFVAAACGDNRSSPHTNDTPPDAPTNTSRCGDGVVDVATEGCDDGNTVDGDGCDSSCRVEGPKCGNGRIETGETCDDGNTAAMDGCSATCAVEMGYMCSGQPSVCSVLPPDGTCAHPFDLTLAMTGTSYSVSASGDTTGGTSQVAAAACDTYMSDGAGPDHQYMFVNPVAQAVQITVGNLGDATDDINVRLTTAVCGDVTTQVPDDTTDGGHADGCTDRGFGGDPETMTFSNLAAGTYYIDVDGYATGDFGTYTLTVQAGVGTCGNGVLEINEECDDNNTTINDGCDAACKVEPNYTCTTASPSVCTTMCGNGTLDGDEDCDDGNTANMDGCSNHCLVEPGYVCDDGEPSVCIVSCGNGHADPGEECDPGATADAYCTATCTLKIDVTEQTTTNNTAATAQVITPVHHLIQGSIPTAGDFDLYKFTLASPKTVTFETFTQYGKLDVSDGVTADKLICTAPNIDTVIRVYDVAADVTDDAASLLFDDDDGDNHCSYLGPLDDDGDVTEGMLPAGTYLLKVNLYSASTTAARYDVEMTVN